MTDETTREKVPPRPELTRRGDRPGAGADTPSGPRTDRTVVPAKKEQEQRDKRDDEKQSGR
jgi:hypothetical protein